MQSNKETPFDATNIFSKELISLYSGDSTISPYEQEQFFFNTIKEGNEVLLNSLLEDVTKSNITIRIGHMSDNSRFQVLFSIISGITLATRYALAGGLSEPEAFRLSDAYLQKISYTSDQEEAISILTSALRDFAHRVSKTKQHGNLSHVVSHCIKYITKNINKKIRLQELAKNSEVSQQYLSSLFHKEVGMTITQYIISEKLKAAKIMIEQTNLPINRIAFTFEFSSQSSFATQFKKMFGLTPFQYRKQNHLLVDLPNHYE